MNRRLICLTVLVGLCASFVPLPVGTIATRQKDQSQPYPCQHRPCGCKSAEQCWKSCCCFTNIQKIAWARQHKVTPPVFVVEAARLEQDEQDAEKTVDVPKSRCVHCCQKQTAKSPARPGCSSRSVVKSCCQPSKSASSAERTSDAKNATAGRTKTVSDETRYVIGIEMQKCKGYGPSSNPLPWAVVPPVERPDICVIPDLWEPSKFVPMTSQVREPPEPPPRLS